MEEMPEGTEASGAKRARISPAPPVASLGDDPLRDILLRLPDMASLASAALACKPWHRVASDPAVFRRFDALRRPPLVVFLLTDRGNMRFPGRSPSMRYVWGTRNPNLVAAAADGDFLFKDLPAVDSVAEEEGYSWDEWRLRGCDGGLQLLSRGYDGLTLAVYDPIARTAVFLNVSDVFGYAVVYYAIVVDESDGSFLIIGIYYHAAIFSSRTGKWTRLDSESRELPSLYGFRSDGMRAGRFAYWRSNTNKQRDLVERILVLDTTTMEWSIINAPFPAGESYCVADMPEHGGLCLVSSKEQCLQHWFRNSIGEWVLMKDISLLNDWMKKIRRDEWMKRLRILAVRANYVYIEFWSIRKPNSYFLVFNLRTRKMTVVRNNAEDPHRGPAFPFFLRLEPLLGPDDGQNVRPNDV